MRVFITGITGYIGTHLAKRLVAGGHSVFGLVREPLNQEYIADIKNVFTPLFWDGSYKSMEEALVNAAPNIIYHLAAYYTGARGREHAEKIINSNITLGAYLLDAACYAGNPPFVCVSSVMTRFNKGVEYRPLNLYAAAKQAFSDLLEYYTDAGLLRAVTVMFTDTYGPLDNRPKILNLIMKAVKNEERIALTDGNQEFAPVYIDDAVSALVCAADYILQNESVINQTFQISTPEVFTLKQVVELMLSVNGWKLNAAWGGRPSPEREMRSAPRIYAPVPGWEPKVSLKEGLKRMAQE